MDQTEETAVQKLKVKIAALLRKADRTDNEHEAEAFGAKARALIQEHRLTMQEVLGSTDPMGRSQIFCPYQDRAYVELASGAARYLGCSCLFGMGWDYTRHRRARYVVFVGRESARVTAELMTPFWWSQCTRHGRRAFREGRVGTSSNQAVRLTLTAMGFRLSSMAEDTAELSEAREEVRDARVDKHRMTLDLDALAVAGKIPTAMQVS